MDQSEWRGPKNRFSSRASTTTASQIGLRQNPFANPCRAVTLPKLSLVLRNRSRVTRLKSSCIFYLKFPFIELCLIQPQVQPALLEELPRRGAELFPGRAAGRIPPGTVRLQLHVSTKYNICEHWYNIQVLQF
jgi:hypothetical protein